MTTERRIGAVEAALTPTELVVAWLTEAHAYGGVDAFVRATLADENFVPPINRLGQAAADGARTRMKGKPRDEIDRASDQAVRETLFRFHLVMRINTVCHDVLDREQLLAALFSTRLALLAAAPARKRGGVDELGEIEQLRDLVILSTRSFRAVGAAREEVERRFLAGHPALFPDDATRWVEQLRTTETIEALAIRQASLDGVADGLMPPPEAFGDRVTHDLADFVEPAKVAALEDLDDGRKALGIATSWLRGRMGQLGAFSPPSQDGASHTRLPPTPTP